MSDAAALTVEARIPASLAETLAQQLEQAAHARVASRLRSGDATLWGPQGTPEIGNRLGWLTIAERMLESIGEVTSFAAQVREEGTRDAVLLGMGGSSLAPEVLRRCFGSAQGHPRLHVLDSTDAATVRAVAAQIDLQRTLFVVSSKSGGTIEPLSLFAHFWSLSGRGEQFAAITDPGSGLEALARAHGFRDVFAGDPEIGGRYSALSAFGIVPAALMGVDVGALLAGAAAAWQTEMTAREGMPAPGALAAEELQRAAGVWLGAALSALARAGRDKLTFLISPSLPGLGLWLEQLFAESTGKRGTGILPVADEPPGDVAEYGEDRVFARLADVAAPDERLDALAEELADAGHPVLTVPTAGPPDLGRVFLLWEIAVAVAGWGLQINPFDQPNVQQAKDATKRALAQFEHTGSLSEPGDSDAAAVSELLAGARPPHYVALMGYTQPLPQVDEAIAALRTAIRARGAATTTFGYGPRFLHSTGQYHKGGPRNGRFLQLLHDCGEDLEVPGAGYSFDTLKHAQAAGDLQTLRELGLPAERVRLRGEDAAAALAELTATVNAARGGGT